MAKQGKLSLFHRRRGLHTPSLKIPVYKPYGKFYTGGISKTFGIKLFTRVLVGDVSTI